MTGAETSTPAANGEHAPGPLPVVLLAALGVVFGDIATSPLYALRECFHGEYSIAITRGNLLGVLSLMFWALAIIVSLKYVGLILRADNRGEGGVIALTALVHRAGLERGRPSRWLVACGLFGAALLYGDGMITPAISVLSAVEGLRVAAPALVHWVIPVTIAILLGLFLVQQRGTHRVGTLFGPVILLWLLVLGALGLASIAREPGVLAALDPRHGIAFLLENGGHGFLVLGAVILVVTGAEALYADMGHFGRRPIRITWFALALPALLLNYFGQAALLLRHPEEAHHPFYALVPSWGIVPMLALATSATIIASQAVISGAFSLTRQAVQLGFLPRLRIVHTSPEQIGQIYVPTVNWLLMAATIGLVLGFHSSSQLAAAYGVAVTTTMLIATILLCVVARQVWGFGRLTVAGMMLTFLVVEGAFFAANLGKILHGAWFPLVIGGLFFAVMTTWRRGRQLVGERLLGSATHIEEFQNTVFKEKPQRLPGHAIYLTANPSWAPPALLSNLRHHRGLHGRVTLVSVRTEEIPAVPRADKVEVKDLGDGFCQVTARYGFMETPNVPHVLAIVREQGFDVDIDEATFFLGRETLLGAKRPGMARWRVRLFAFMSRNAQGATDFFGLPPDRVVEIGSQLRI